MASFYVAWLLWLVRQVKPQKWAIGEESREADMKEDSEQSPAESLMMLFGWVPPNSHPWPQHCFAVFPWLSLSVVSSPKDSTMDYFGLLKALDWSSKDSFIAVRPLKHLFEFLVLLVHLKAAVEGCNQYNKNGSDNKALVVLPEHIKTSTHHKGAQQ